VRIRTPAWTPGTGPSNAVALEVLINGPISRSEIARTLDLSAGSLTRLSTPLIDSGLLVEVGERLDGRAGRPSRLLDVIPESRHFIGLKLTGEEVLGVATDLRASVLATAATTLSSREPASVIDAVAEVVATLGAQVPAVTAIGLGIGGRVGQGGLVHSAPFLDWANVELGAMLEAATGLPVVVDNDVTAFTEYERWFGAGRNADRFAVLTVGAGVGYGLVIGGEVIVDDDAGIGLVGHWPLDPFGPVCASGHRGCAQSVLTQSAIVQGVSAALDRQVGYDEALDLAESGEPGARRVVNDAGRGLGRLIAAVANLTMPELVVLGWRSTAMPGPTRCRCSPPPATTPSGAAARR
jgi:predicted NBD/HSP70 family sugar kinase